MLSVPSAEGIFRSPSPHFSSLPANSIRRHLLASLLSDTPNSLCSSSASALHSSTSGCSHIMSRSKRESTPAATADADDEMNDRAASSSAAAATSSTAAEDESSGRGAPRSKRARATTHRYSPPRNSIPLRKFEQMIDDTSAAAASSSSVAAASRPASPHASSSSNADEDAPLLRSAPFFKHFRTSLSFLGPATDLPRQYDQFYKLWRQFQKDHDGRIRKENEKKLGTTVINAFEAFRAIVTRGGYHRIFVLLPVGGEIPPLDANGIPLYAMTAAEMPYEQGSPSSASMPKLGEEWSKKIGMLRDGRFMRNQTIMRTFKLYYEKYLLAFEHAYCWTTMDDNKKPRYNAAKRMESSIFPWDLDNVELEFLNIPKRYQPTDKHEIQRVLKLYQSMAISFGFSGNAALNDGILADPKQKAGGAPIWPPPRLSTVQRPRSPSPPPAPRTVARISAHAASSPPTFPDFNEIDHLHRIGTYALMRTLQASFLSNPLTMRTALLAELIKSMNHLMVATKHYAARMSIVSEREFVDSGIRRALLRNDDAVEGSIDATLALSAALSSTLNSWYFDILLLFEYDIISALLDQLIHPRSIEQRIEIMLETDRAETEYQDQQMDIANDGAPTPSAHPLLPGLPNSFRASSRYNLLPPAAHKFFVSQYLSHLDQTSYPNLTRVIFTILQNLSYPGSPVQHVVENETKKRVPPGTPDSSIFVPTVRMNLIQHPLVITTLLDYIDLHNTDAMSLAIDATDETLEERFDVLPQSGTISFLYSSSNDERKVPDEATFRLSTTTSAPTQNGVVKMEIDGEEEEKKENLVHEASSLSPTMTSASASTISIPLSKFASPECRYLALTTLANLAPDLPWLTQPSMFASSVDSAESNVTHTSESLDRERIFWREMTREMDAYHVHVAKQTAILASIPLTSYRPSAIAAATTASLSNMTPPPRGQLEFLLSAFQLLCNMVQTSGKREGVETLLPYSDQSAVRDMSTGQMPLNFYSTLLYIATTTLDQIGSGEDAAPRHNNGIAPPPSRPLSWMYRMQMGALEVLIQFLLHSRLSIGLFFTSQQLVSYLVNVLEVPDRRLRRTAAAAIAAVCTQIHARDERYRLEKRYSHHVSMKGEGEEEEETRVNGLHHDHDAATSANTHDDNDSMPLLLAMMHPLQSRIFAQCAQDEDVSTLLSKWCALFTKLAQRH